jgi:dienelactone hydrolase
VHRIVAVLAAALIVSTGLTGCSANPGISLTVGPAVALQDTPLAATVTGLKPQTRVQLTVTTRAANGITWHSAAIYATDATGGISLDSPAVAGSYTGSSRSGLLDTLYPTTGRIDQPFSPPTPWTLTVTAMSKGHSNTSRTVTRRSPAELGVTHTDLRPASGGLYGTLFAPKSSAHRGPAVVIWGGAEGGLSTATAASLLAAHGYPALALAYFGLPGLPANLDRIPLEYFATAIRLLDRQPGVDPAKVMGVHYPSLVHAVIVNVPSSVVNPSLHGGQDAAWTLAGRDLPHVSAAELGQTSPKEQDAIIPVDKIAGPVMAECAGHDRVWPSCNFLASIRSRLAATPGKWQPTYLQYPQAGHSVSTAVPWLPAPGGVPVGQANAGGGTSAADGAGRADAWPRFLAFIAALA